MRRSIPSAALCLVVLVLGGCETQKSLTRKRIRSTERGLLRAVYLKGQAPEKLTLTARMRFYSVPGAGIAVMDRNGLEWAKAYGARNALSPEPVTAETLFQAGPLSQPVAAAAALRLAREGMIDLDSDIGGRLREWKIPRNAFTGKSPVTVRGLLTHTAGFPVSPWPGFSDPGRLPSLLELLSGPDPAGGGPGAPVVSPGPQVRPSEVGFGVLQQVLEEATGRRFSDLARQSVLDPLGMAHSTFEVPLGAGWRPEAASGHGRDGRPLEGGWLNYPAAAASGMWTTPGDLLRFAAGVLRTARGEDGPVLSPDQARSMLTPQAGNRSLGFAVDGSGEDVRFHLTGRTAGFTCSLEAYPFKGQGAVIMTNSENGLLLTEEILRGLGAVYGWPDFRPREKTLFRLDPSIYRQYVGRYQITPEYFLDVTHEDYYLVIRPTGQAPTKFYVESQSFFFSMDPYILIQFLTDGRGNVTGLVLWQQDFRQEGKKVG